MTPAAPQRPLLVVAGEASGDAMAAGVLDQLQLPAFGMGGPQLRRSGANLVLNEPAIASIGPIGALARAPLLLSAYRRLRRAVDQQRPAAALLVGFSAFNARLGAWLVRRGLKVLWYSPPQVWAWHSRRVYALGRCCQRVALLFPFEPVIWQRAGVRADYVGHPSLERRYAPHAQARGRLGLSAERQAIALLPGSRSGEVKRMLEPMLVAARSLLEQRSIEARVLLSPALPTPELAWARQASTQAGVQVMSGIDGLPAFDLALATSGTVTLECALAGVPPVVCYRTDPLTARLARHLLETPHIALPNIVVGRRLFPELVQRQVTADALSQEALALLGRLPAARRQCDLVRQTLEAGAVRKPSAAVADLLRGWLT